MRLLSSTALLPAPTRRERFSEADTSSRVAALVVVGGFFLFIGLMVGEKGCFAASLVFTLLFAFALFVPRAISRSRTRARERKDDEQNQGYLAAAAAAERRREEILRSAQSLDASEPPVSPEAFIEALAATAATVSADASDLGAVYQQLAWSLINNDGNLDEREDEILSAFTTRFHVAEDRTSRVARAVDAFRRLRAAKETLPVVDDVSIPLKRGEVCHHRTTGSVLKPNGSTLREGDIYLTSKRVLVVGNGTTSLDFNKLLHVKVDPYRDSVGFTLDGRQNAVEVVVPDTMYFAMLAKMVAERELNQ